MALFGIMLYYAVIIAWCVNYLFYSINLSWGNDPGGFFFKHFLQVSDSPFHLGGIRIPIASATFFVWFLCWIICYREVNHGIERACTIFMPLLFVLTLVLVGWTLTLNGAYESGAPPRQIPSQYITREPKDDSIFTGINGIREVLQECYDSHQTFSEAEVPWAYETEWFDTSGYERFEMEL